MTIKDLRETPTGLDDPRVLKVRGMDEKTLKHCKKHPWEKHPYWMSNETKDQADARYEHYRLEKFKDHPLVGNILKLIELDKKKHALLRELLQSVTYRLEKGLPLSKDLDTDSMTQEEASEAAEKELQKLQGLNKEGIDIQVEPRSLLAAIVICSDEGEFLQEALFSDGEEGLKALAEDIEGYMNVDLAGAHCFKTVDEATKFCKERCPAGWQALANPCTAIEEVLYEKEGDAAEQSQG